MHVTYQVTKSPVSYIFKMATKVISQLVSETSFTRLPPKADVDI